MNNIQPKPCYIECNYMWKEGDTLYKCTQSPVYYKVISPHFKETPSLYGGLCVPLASFNLENSKNPMEFSGKYAIYVHSKEEAESILDYLNEKFPNPTNPHKIEAIKNTVLS